MECSWWQVPESVVLKGALADAVQSQLQLHQNLPPTRAESSGPRQSGATTALIARLRADPTDQKTDAGTIATNTPESIGQTSLLLNDAEAWLKGSAELAEADPAFQAASLENLDIRARHEQFQSELDEAGRGGPPAQRTVAARAELTALTPSVERFFGNTRPAATPVPEAASLTAALAGLADTAALKEEERAALLSLVQRTVEQSHGANK